MGGKGGTNYNVLSNASYVSLLFPKSLQGAFFHKFRDIIMGGVIPFTILEDTFPYKIKDSLGKLIPSKDITLGN